MAREHTTSAYQQMAIKTISALNWGSPEIAPDVAGWEKKGAPGKMAQNFSRFKCCMFLLAVVGIFMFTLFLSLSLLARIRPYTFRILIMNACVPTCFSQKSFTARCNPSLLPLHSFSQTESLPYIICYPIRQGCCYTSMPPLAFLTFQSLSLSLSVLGLILDPFDQRGEEEKENLPFFFFSPNGLARTALSGLRLGQMHRLSHMHWLCFFCFFCIAVVLINCL